MFTTVDDVESGARHDVGLFDTGKGSEVGVERDSLAQSTFAQCNRKSAHLLGSSSLRDRHGDTEDGVGSKLALVVGPIELDEEVINLLLAGDGDFGLDQGRSNGLDDGVNGLENTCPESQQLCR